MPHTLQQLQELLLHLLPGDGTAVGNISLLAQVQAAAAAAGHAAPTEDAFKIAREALLASGQVVKGRGRGGATARVLAEPDQAQTSPHDDPEATQERPDFALEAHAPAPATASPAKARTKAAASPSAPTDASLGAPQVLAYRHPDRRKNNPEVGLVSEASDPDQAKTPWAYDPHLDPALQFDSARAEAERLIEDALTGNDPAAMRHALETLRRMSAPYLQWTGKSERTSFDVDTVSLHVHERIDALSILSAVAKRQEREAGKGGKGGKDAKAKAANQGFQPGLFEAPFESLPLRSAVDFYKHDRGWANRLVAGDSLLVMNSLLQKEGMAGQVQMIYIDPPYGIKYGSNFQPFTNKRDVKDRSDADLTQEPEMIKAFRDTWELGIHSYLTYLRDRLHDLEDLGYRLMRQLVGQDHAPSREQLPDNAIVIARAMGPAALLDYDRKRLRGIVLEEGTANSHVSIVARALGIPAVGEVPNAPGIADPGDAIIVGEYAILQDVRAIGRALAHRHGGAGPHP